MAARKNSSIKDRLASRRRKRQDEDAEETPAKPARRRTASAKPAKADKKPAAKNDSGGRAMIATHMSPALKESIIIVAKAEDTTMSALLRELATAKIEAHARSLKKGSKRVPRAIWTAIKEAKDT